METNPPDPEKKSSHPWRIICWTVLGWVIAAIPFLLELGSSRKTVFARSGGNPSPPPTDYPKTLAGYVIIAVIPFSFMLAMHFTGWGGKSFLRRVTCILVGSFLIFAAWTLLSMAVLFCLEYFEMIP